MELACEQALLFGQAKRASRERASEGPFLCPSGFAACSRVLARLVSLAQIGELARRLSGNEHINETVKKASKRLYFLVQLKRAKLPCRDLVLFYATCIRSILFMQRLFSFMLCPSIYSKYAIQPLAAHVFIFA